MGNQASQSYEALILEAFIVGSGFSNKKRLGGLGWPNRYGHQIFDPTHKLAQILILEGQKITASIP